MGADYQSRHKSYWRLSGDQALRLAQQGSDVHDPPNVHGIDLWDDLLSVWPIAQNHRHGPIFGACRGGYRERGYSAVIANAFYLPHHLLPEAELEDTPGEQAGVVPLRHVGRKAE